LIHRKKILKATF